MRSFTTPAGLFVWLPQAAAWTRAKNGNVRAAERFLWITKWWAQIAGWILFPGTVFAAVAAVDPDLILYITDDRRRLLSPSVKAPHGGGGWNWVWWDDEDNEDYSEDWITRIVGATIMLSIDIAGWVMFYVSYKDALKYGQYLVARNIAAIQDETTDAGF